jgi:hypothetical protein
MGGLFVSELAGIFLSEEKSLGGKYIARHKRHNRTLSSWFCTASSCVVPVLDGGHRTPARRGQGFVLPTHRYIADMYLVPWYHVWENKDE